jgi:phage shock protein C
MEAQENQVALPLRSDTILGVCEALGQDFGFHPNFLRIPFAASVLWSPIWAIGAYLALGLVVLASRWLAPAPNAATAAFEEQRGDSAADDGEDLRAAA